MQADSTVEEIVDTIKRFRILCVGRAGVGKSSLINRVFRIDKALVSHGQPGEANIEDEFTSPENEFFVLHDSKGFEPGDTKTFDTVRTFIEDRRSESVLLEKRLHAVWLCTATPTAGGRVFETGDEQLLQLAHKTNTPVVIIFTQYDRLLRTKKYKLEKDASLDSNALAQRSEEEAQKVLAECVKSLENAMGRMDIPMAPFVNVSVRTGYDKTILSLVEVTFDHVRDKLKGDAINIWVMWAMAQRVSLPVKLRTCVSKAMDYYRRALFSSAPGLGQMLLRECVGKVHQEIIKCWNFTDDEKILSSEEFMQLMLYLVQRIHESQNQNESQSTPSTAVDTVSKYVSLVTTVVGAGPVAPPVAILGLSYFFISWLSNAVLDNLPKVQCHLMTYTVDLIKVLESLADFTMTPKLLGRPTWDTLQEAFEAYDRSGACQKNHSRIRETLQQSRQSLDSRIFHRTLCELVGVEWTPETKSN